MRQIGELLTDLDEMCERVTGQTMDEWEAYFKEQCSIATSVGTVRRGQNFTSTEMFGLYRDGELVKNGWKNILGLAQDDIKAVLVDILPNELTSYEQDRQDKARRRSKTQFDAPTIKRVIRFQIADKVFDRD